MASFKPTQLPSEREHTIVKYIITRCKQKDCIKWYIASAGVKKCLREQNHEIKKFYAKPKVFGLKFYVSLRVKYLLRVLYVEC